MDLEPNLSPAIWDTDPRFDAAPRWAYAMAIEISRDHGLTVPRIKFMKPEGLFQWGGKYFPDNDAIAVIDTGDERVRPLFIHENAHRLLRKRIAPSSHHGQHDAAFYTLVEKLYRAYGVPLRLARRVEAPYRDHWPPHWSLTRWPQTAA